MLNLKTRIYNMTEIFVNLTPHTINFYNYEFLTSGIVARINENKKEHGLWGGIPLIEIEYGEVVDLPEPKDGVLYIVSHMLRAALPERKDLVSPGELIRDKEGNIIACKNFVISDQNDCAKEKGANYV